MSMKFIIPSDLERKILNTEQRFILHDMEK